MKKEEYIKKEGRLRTVFIKCILEVLKLIKILLRFQLLLPPEMNSILVFLLETQFIFRFVCLCQVDTFCVGYELHVCKFVRFEIMCASLSECVVSCMCVSSLCGMRCLRCEL